MDPKILTEAAWKAHVIKFKLKDNGLQKALAAFEKLDDKAHEELAQAAALISKLAASMQKVKEAAANATVLKHLKDVTAAADADRKNAEADAKKQAGADKQKEKDDKDKGDDDKDDKGDKDDKDDKEMGDFKAQLTAALAKLKGSKDLSFEFVVCEAKPVWGVHIARKITPKHKEDVTKATGGKHFLKPGTCHFEQGKLVLALEDKVSGLAQKIQAALKSFTGKKYGVKVGDESAGGDDDDTGTAQQKPAGAASGGPSTGSQPADAGASSQPTAGAAGQTGGASASKGFSITASVGQGGKNKPDDVTSTQTALNKLAKAGLKVDGKCGPTTIAAIKAFQKSLGMKKLDGLVEVGRGTARGLAGLIKPGPAPAPPAPAAPPTLGKASLDKAPDVWHSTRGLITKNIGELKKGVNQHYAQEHPDLVKTINENMKKLDRIVDMLGTDVADALAKAKSATNPTAKKAALDAAKKVLVGKITYVKSEKLITHIDSNPFGVNTNLKKILTDSLTHMAQAIGT